MSSRIETISILGGGWSARTYDRARLPGEVIGVNDAAILAPCSQAVSMDRLWVENRYLDLYGRAGFTAPAILHARRSALKNVRDDFLLGFIRPFENDHTSVDMTDVPGFLNGTNSGLCAINLAYQMRPRRLILFGFDMNRSPEGLAYWFPDYPWAKPGGATSAGKYQAWAAEFEIVARQLKAAGIEVVNASPGSAIKAFPKVNPEELLA